MTDKSGGDLLTLQQNPEAIGAGSARVRKSASRAPQREAEVPRVSIGLYDALDQVTRQWTGLLIAVHIETGVAPGKIIRAGRGARGDIVRAKRLVGMGWLTMAGRTPASTGWLEQAFNCSAQTICRKARQPLQGEDVLPLSTVVIAARIVAASLAPEDVAAAIAAGWTGRGTRLGVSAQPGPDLVARAREWLREAGIGSPAEP